MANDIKGKPLRRGDLVKYFDEGSPYQGTVKDASGDSPITVTNGKGETIELDVRSSRVQRMMETINMARVEKKCPSCGSTVTVIDGQSGYHTDPKTGFTCDKSWAPMAAFSGPRAPSLFHEGRHYVLDAAESARVTMAPAGQGMCPGCDQMRRVGPDGRIMYHDCKGGGVGKKPVKGYSALAAYSCFDGGRKLTVLADARGTVDMASTREAAIADAEAQLKNWAAKGTNRGKGWDMTDAQAANLRRWLERQKADPIKQSTFAAALAVGDRVRLKRPGSMGGEDGPGVVRRVNGTEIDVKWSNPGGVNGLYDLSELVKMEAVSMADGLPACPMCGSAANVTKRQRLVGTSTPPYYCSKCGKLFRGTDSPDARVMPGSAGGLGPFKKNAWGGIVGSDS